MSYGALVESAGQEGDDEKSDDGEWQCEDHIVSPALCNSISRAKEKAKDFAVLGFPMLNNPAIRVLWVLYYPTVGTPRT
jgi:hypothetical protein